MGHEDECPWCVEAGVTSPPEYEDLGCDTPLPVTEPPMTFRERLRAAWVILRAPYIVRVDIAWTRADGRGASRIWIGRS